MKSVCLELGPRYRPGGSYDRRHWDFPADPSSSFAEHMAGRGSAVAAADHLGVRRSSRPDEVDAVVVAR
jgi:hypothetical protein